MRRRMGSRNSLRSVILSLTWRKPLLPVRALKAHSIGFL
jgi:hypothetical protein